MPGDRDRPRCLRRPRRRRGQRAASALASGGLDYYVAAIRECFEESGLLFARGDGERDRSTLDGQRRGAAGAVARRAAPRRAQHRRVLRRGSACRSPSIALAYLSHWLTPLGRPKRFDTRFFIAAAPPAQTAAHDGTEMVEQLWLRPADALARSATLKLLTPTQKTLETVWPLRRRRRADGLGARAARGRADRCRASPSAARGCGR